ncbi:polysaccharide biosynthesis/export family protein [Mucilaginibacter sp. UYCu711]|uniref:polysaccharide biosynthesis/export family protein n=1 Tax=Mucilaginibacter sp. UYCu711 TaxID=3156339 RepID=UPI003D20FB23
MRTRYKSSFFLILTFFFFSCADVRKTIYFADQKDGIITSNNNSPLTELQSNDILSIAISSANMAATTIFNTPNFTSVTSATSTGSTIQSPGYLINKEGFIQFPVLGDIKAAGLTTNQLRIYITQQLTNKKLLIDPIVAVRQLNFKVSILGEVNHPTVLTVPNEKISLLEALGLAGDITIYGRKDNITIIREENGEKKIKHLDLNSSELFQSQYYYLKSNDIVYVQSNNAKVAGSSKGAQTLPIVLSALSLIAIIVEAALRK